MTEEEWKKQVAIWNDPNYARIKVKESMDRDMEKYFWEKWGKDIGKPSEQTGEQQ